VESVDGAGEDEDEEGSLELGAGESVSVPFIAGDGYQLEPSVELEVEVTGVLTFQLMSGEVEFQVGAGLEVELEVELESV
jgi:hypothetical protein